MPVYNTYGCTYYFYNNNKFCSNTNKACWAGIKYRTAFYNFKNIDSIYIDFNTRYKELNPYIKRIVSLINNITPCSIVRNKEKKAINCCNYSQNLNCKYLIKYTFIKKDNINEFYAINLTLLNFIRMLWYDPQYLDIDKYKEIVLKRVTPGKDSLWFLMNCIKECVIEGNNRVNYGNHSCVYKNIIPKSKKWLLEKCKCTRCENIMTNKL